MVIFTLWIALILSQQKTNFDWIKEYVKTKTICKIIMPSEDIKISEFSQYKNLTKFCEFLRKHAMKIINFHKKWSY